MNKFSKVIAVALAATMVFGSSITAFADEVTSSTGAGASEGHVDQKKTNVVLPTSVANTTFAYTMDPEKLIETTAHGKYGDDVVFPASNDTYVYFNNGTNDQSKTVYANTSAKVKITNKSSHAINLTASATATATEGGTDIPLVAKDAYASATAPSLYLGLVVGSETAVAIDEETPATKTVPIAGTPGNFKIAVKADNSGYEYRELTLAEYKEKVNDDTKTQADYDATWTDVEIGLEGGVTTGKAITASTTAPAVAVTWSWVDPDAAPASYTVTYKSNYTDGPTDVTESVTAGGTPEGPETAFTRSGYTLAGWATASDGTPAALSTYTINANKDLYAIWIEQKTGHALWYNSESVFYVGTTGSAGFDLGEDEVTAVTVNGKAVDYDTTSVSSGDWVKVTPAAIQAIGEDNGWAHGTELVFKVWFGSYEYTATYTQP